MHFLKIYIKASLTNITINLTSMNGNSIYSISTGHLNFPKSKRVLAFAAKTCMVKIIHKLYTFKNIKSIQVYVKGIGRARTKALNELIKANLPIKIIQDNTPIPHNGCRAKKIKRI